MTTAADIFLFNVRIRGTLTDAHRLTVLHLAAWTAPRGDDNSLWLPWFPFLVLSAFPLAACHWSGTLAGRRWRHRSVS
jgi:hypothetical protein